VGNSENAVLSRIYVAMTVFLLLCSLKFRSRLGGMQEIIQLLRVNLFCRIGLEELFRPPPNMSKNKNDLRLLRLAS
jgi:hypothetical protein